MTIGYTECGIPYALDSEGKKELEQRGIKMDYDCVRCKKKTTHVRDVPTKDEQKIIDEMYCQFEGVPEYFTFRCVECKELFPFTKSELEKILGENGMDKP